MSTLYSAVNYTADGVITEFTIPFPYLDRDDIYVFYKPGTPPEATYTQLATTDWVFLSDNRIDITGQALVSGDKVVIRRFTHRANRLVDFHDGSVLTEQDLNLITLQFMYILQEILDYAIAGGSPDVDLPGGPGDPGDTDLDLDTIIQNVIDELLNSQLFQDLIALIDLIDVNAEAIIGTILNTHENWSLGRVRDGAIADANDLIDSAFGTLAAQDARIVTIETAYVNEDEALAARIDALQVSFDTFEADTDASILNIQQAIANGDSALAQQITDLEASVTNADAQLDARLTTVEVTNVNQDSALASLVTQVDARIEYDELEGLLITSSHISGIKAEAEANTASVSTIESSLATVTTDVLNNTVNLAAVQSTVSAQATDIDANSTWRQSMATAFGLPLNEGGSVVASAIQTQWETYADVESATAQIVTSLQANTTPILFRDTIPDQSESSFGDPPQWPKGTLWFDIGNGMRPYIWDPDATAGSVNAAGYPYVIGPILTGGAGYWVAARDEDLNTSLGAAIEESYESIVDPVTGEVRAELTTTLQAVLGDDIAAVDNSLQAWIDPTTGIMNSQWALRLNQYINGSPVIAGVGLGLQSDPNNPEAGATSRFIVMSDLFGVVAPPSGPDLTGSISLADVRTPFIIDTRTDLVGVDGNLVVAGTLSAYTGSMDTVYAERLVATNLTTDTYGLTPVSDFGTRLEIASDSYWSGTDGRDYLIWAGTGSKNAANAMFYVDTNGNGFFAGEVTADNVTGSLNDLSNFDASGNISITSNWTTVHAETLPARTRPRNAMCSVSCNVFGAGADNASLRLQIRYDTTGGGTWSSWQTVATATFDTPSAVPAALSGMRATNTPYAIQAQLEAKTNSGNNHTINNVGGFLLGIR